MIKAIRSSFRSFLLNHEVALPESKDLSDFVIIITGASRGLGRAVSEVLYKRGAKLVVVSKNITDSEINLKNSKRVLLIDGDITDVIQCQEIISLTVKKFGKVDVLINNAGIILDKEFEKISVKEIENLLAVNLKGTFLISQVVTSAMKQKREGLIINIGSKISHNTNVSDGKVLYATSKYAIEGFSLALSKELRKYGIRVSCLMPATINTFPTPKAKKLLSPYQVGESISNMIKLSDIDFEAVILKSKFQDI